MKHSIKIAIITSVMGFLLTTNLSSQIVEDFSDGNFTINPNWSGDTSEFKITNSSAIPPEMKPALQLDGTGTDTSVLYLPNEIINNTEWQFWTKLSFNTSVNNFLRIYLVSDSPELKGDLNGYFLQIGGGNDSIGLYRQNGLSEQLIFQAENMYSGNSSNIFRFKILRDTTGNWELLADPTGGFDFNLQGAGFNNDFIVSNYFGIFCKYTSSNATKFYFDDIFVQEIVNDTVAPQVISVSATGPANVKIIFSEDVELSSAENILHYFIDEGIGNPVLAQRDGSDHTIVFLEFENIFDENLTYTLQVSGISDLSGNIMETASFPIVYSGNQQVAQFTLLINEIMADVNPSPVGIPEADFLELFNASSDTINLSGFTIKPRESADPITLPDISIYPSSFLLLVNITDTSAFSDFGPVAGLSGFILNNEGVAVLRDNKGKLIHSIGYTSEWYQNEDKENGGWSLEQIDPYHPCSGQQNWKATESELGGTPGSLNSVNGVNVWPLRILSTTFIDNKNLEISFSHIMDSVSISNPDAFNINPNIGNPVSVSLDDISFDKILLQFANNFDTNILYTLTLTDTLANCSGQSFLYGQNYQVVLPSQANPFEIVINEIMFDPDPPNGLPEFEFLELLNTTNLYLAIKDWILEIGTIQKPIPDFVISPGEFVLFTENNAINLFSMYGRSFGFSSLGLSNSGTSISILNKEGELISSISYSPDWIDDTDKKEGGWSLEQIDPYNPCAGTENWKASEILQGGTPGAINSVDADNPIIPEIEKVIVKDKNSIEVSFNQFMEKKDIISPELYFIDKGIGYPDQVMLVDATFKKVSLEFEQDFQKKILYRITTEFEIENCSGLKMQKGSYFDFGFHEPAEKNDIAINEVLFNPVGNGVDFVEIYNRSNKIINLYDLRIGNLETDQFGHTDTSYKNVSENDALILMAEYLVLTSDPNKVMEQYYTGNPKGFNTMSSFPVFNNESGTVALSAKSGKLLDIFSYHEDMHHPLLGSLEGVSLERISYNRPAGDKTNWHSASSDIGYASPAYKNSQFSEGIENKAEIMIDPEVFSPDNDGYNDFVNIQYNFDNPGFTASITIYDSEGRLVKYLIQNELLGTTGTFSWDGRTDNNQKAPIGIYIVFFEAFDVNGNIKRIKKPVVLAAKL
ncbi:MAG: lamin tail domain-containing protein [Bacteroidales bacterium]|nr:lamin tail domain-containing protein [Bacteroidales bacterium]